MQLSEFFDYKSQLFRDLLTNEKIVRLLVDDEKVPSDPQELVYKRLFPFEYVPDVTTTGQTFICCDVDINNVSNKTFLTPVLYIWVFTHKNKLKLPNGGVRTDELCSEINKTINGSRYYGLGELELYSVRRFIPITDYLGKSMMYQAKDFNRLAENGKPAPTNRKHR